METKASYILVGACTLLALLLFAGILVFAVKSTGDGKEDYLVVFQGSVAGLSIGNDVRFNGIRVGQVSQIKIDHADPSVVNVLVSIADDTPVRESSEATLEMQGITGLSVVSITGGQADSPYLKPKKGQEYAQIRAGRSRIESIIDEAPDLLVSANQLIQRGSGVLSDENQKNITLAVQSLAHVAEALARNAESMEQTLTELNKASKNLNTMLISVNRVTNNDIAGAMTSTRRAFDEMNGFFKSVKPGMERFSKDSVDEISRLLADTNKLIRSLNSMVQRADSDPRRFFFGDNVPEYRIP